MEKFKLLICSTGEDSGKIEHSIKQCPVEGYQNIERILLDKGIREFNLYRQKLILLSGILSYFALNQG